MITTPSSWYLNEFSDINFGDARLNQRITKIAAELSHNFERSINYSVEKWSDTKAAYNFFANEKVTKDEIMREHRRHTVERCLDEKSVYVVQDTTFLNYDRFSSIEGLGPIAKVGKATSQGLVMHSAYALNGRGQPLGLLDQEIWAREERRSKRVHNQCKPIEEKESFKWISSLRTTNKSLYESSAQVIHLCDSEADIYELFCEASRLEEKFIVRCHHDRKINRPSRESRDRGTHLIETLSEQPILATFSMEVPNENKSGMRQAEFSVKAITFSLTAPSGKNPEKDNYTETITLNAIQSYELSPPKGSTPLEIILFTNLPIDSSDKIISIIKNYSFRWQIEVFHRILKTTCNVEKCRLSTAKKLINYLSLMSIIAWRVHWLTWTNKIDAESPCDKILSSVEWQFLDFRFNKKVADSPMTVRQATHYIARLAGFNDRKCDKEPGAQVLARGLMKLSELVQELKTTRDFIITYG